MHSDERLAESFVGFLHNRLAPTQTSYESKSLGLPCPVCPQSNRGLKILLILLLMLTLGPPILYCVHIQKLMNRTIWLKKPGFWSQQSIVYTFSSHTCERDSWNHLSARFQQQIPGTVMTASVVVSCWKDFWLRYLLEFLSECVWPSREFVQSPLLSLLSGLPVFLQMPWWTKVEI